MMMSPSTPNLPACTRRHLSYGSPLTYRTPTNSPESDDWHTAEAVEIDRLLVTTTMHAIHLYQQPLDRCGDNTYY